MATHDQVDDELLDSVDRRADELLRTEPGRFLPAAQRFVQEVLTTRRPDGTSPPPELLGELLRSVLELVDERLVDELRAGPTGGVEPAWLVAWRSCADDPATVASLLTTLDDEPSTAGIPPISPLVEDWLHTEPGG